MKKLLIVAVLVLTGCASHMTNQMEDWAAATKGAEQAVRVVLNGDAVKECKHLGAVKAVQGNAGDVNVEIQRGTFLLHGNTAVAAPGPASTHVIRAVGLHSWREELTPGQIIGEAYRCEQAKP